MGPPGAVFCLVLLGRAVLGQHSAGDACIDSYTKTEGRCTEAEKCRSAREDFQRNGIRPTQCGFVGTTGVLVCCRDGFSILQTPALNTRPKQTDNRLSSDRTGSVSTRKCAEYAELVTERVSFGTLSLDATPMTLTAPKCNFAGTELIVGGEDAKQGEFPHMAAIGWATYNNSYSFECGGALISSRFVLTAGHCTYSSSTPDGTPAIVRLGDQNLDPKVRDGANPVEVAIRNIYKHPDYKSPKRYNDVALLELATDVEFNKDIRPACLWNEDNFGNHQKAIATGWGVTDSTTGRTSNVLQKVSLSVLENGECNEKLQHLMNRKWQGFQDSQLCAGETREGKDTCQGDSGGPLQVVTDTNQCVFKIIGVTSFGPRACGHLPAVYSRVSSFVPWIESVVWPGE